MTGLTIKQVSDLLDKKLKNFATKDDLVNLHRQIEYRIDEAEVRITQVVQNTKADKKDFENITKRVDKIEKALRTV